MQRRDHTIKELTFLKVNGRSYLKIKLQHNGSFLYEACIWFPKLFINDQLRVGCLSPKTTKVQFASCKGIQRFTIKVNVYILWHSITDAILANSLNFLLELLSNKIKLQLCICRRTWRKHITRQHKPSCCLCKFGPCMSHLAKLKALNVATWP